MSVLEGMLGAISALLFAILLALISIDIAIWKIHDKLSAITRRQP